MYRQTCKEQNNHIKKTSQLALSDDFWTASPCEIDNSTHGSISSTSTLMPVHDAHVAPSFNNPSEYVNHGLLLWNQTRQKWVEFKRPKRVLQQPPEPKLSWNASYESVLGSNKPFLEPIPLSEMVDFLVDIWEQDGLYD